MPLRLRLLALFLAVLPALWAYCPCCLAGGDCFAPKASKVASTGARRACPCCAKRSVERGSEAPTAPEDCDGCAAYYARGGAVAAPAAVELPAPVALALAACPAAAAPLRVAALPARGDGPAPPGPRLESISTVVLLI